MKQIMIKIKIFLECWHFLLYTLKHNASVHTDSNINKMRYTLMRENHVIEKGLSMKNPKKGFGQLKVSNLIKRINKYSDLYFSIDSSFLIYPICTIAHYIQYTKESGTDIEKIESEFDNLCKKLKKKGLNFNTHEVTAGVIDLKYSDFKENITKPFATFAQSRHSVRYFKNEIPPKELIEQALSIARFTPSACNRQSWHTHIFVNGKAQDLIKMQGGANGFEQNIHMAIVITADANAFLCYEIHQPYIDGALYAMSLIYSLHAEGLGVIPLSLGFYSSKLNQIKKTFEIPQNEIPIMILGVGLLDDNFKVAVSTRLNISKTNTYHY